MADERERYVDREPPVVEGDDDIPRQPSPPLDPYTPEPGARRGERRAFRTLWLAWLLVAILVAVVVWATLR
ncbi:MAG: hypothetical protein ICV59_02285 [Thermoleophilia bacterium]|nr:hypothetical protein [Thermoleophilia bacterium]